MESTSCVLRSDASGVCDGPADTARLKFDLVAILRVQEVQGLSYRLMQLLDILDGVAYAYASAEVVRRCWWSAEVRLELTLPLPCVARHRSGSCRLALRHILSKPWYQ